MPKRLDTSYHKRMLASRMENPEFRAEYERARREIDQVDSVVRQLDELREAAGLSKAELARRSAATRRASVGSSRRRPTPSCCSSHRSPRISTPRSASSRARRRVAARPPRRESTPGLFVDSGRGLGRRLLQGSRRERAGDRVPRRLSGQGRREPARGSRRRRQAPPPQYSGGGKWEAMHGSMGGYYEVRATGPQREQFRLFCVLENAEAENRLAADSAGRRSR